jgi:hypothetical protein
VCVFGWFKFLSLRRVSWPNKVFSVFISAMCVSCCVKFSSCVCVVGGTGWVGGFGSGCKKMLGFLLLRNSCNCSDPLPCKICSAARASRSPVSSVLGVLTTLGQMVYGFLVGPIVCHPLTLPELGGAPAGAACAPGESFLNFSAFNVAPLPLRRSASGVS